MSRQTLFGQSQLKLVYAVFVYTYSSYLCSSFSPTAKADKKAAQAKVTQQENKRAVRGFVCDLLASPPPPTHYSILCDVSSRNSVPLRQSFDTCCRLPLALMAVYTLQEREGELRAMARKIRMK